jgi:hypothetical protein
VETEHGWTSEAPANERVGQQIGPFLNHRATFRLYRDFVARRRRRAWIRRFANRRATEGPADVLDSTSRSPTERNAVDMPGSAAAVESP